MSARERFEAAYATNGCTWHWSGSPQSPYLVMDCGTVIPHGVEWMRWRQSWQAARAEALEEAALWHEDEARRISGEIAASLQIMRENASAFVGLNTSMDHEYAQAETHREAAASIRALKDKEPA